MKPQRYERRQTAEMERLSFKEGDDTLEWITVICIIGGILIGALI